jgi:hypothetical protein
MRWEATMIAVAAAPTIVAVAWIGVVRQIAEVDRTQPALLRFRATALTDLVPRPLLSAWLEPKWRLRYRPISLLHRNSRRVVVVPAAVLAAGGVRRPIAVALVVAMAVALSHGTSDARRKTALSKRN